MRTFPSPFCPRCRALLPPDAQRCPHCGWERPAEDVLPPPGEPFWQVSLKFAPRGALAVADLVIFWGGERGDEGALVALEQKTGVQRWTFAAPHAIEGGVVCKEDRLYFGTAGLLGEGACICLEAASGREVWRAEGLPGGVWGQPVLGDAWGLVGLDNGQIFAFALASGEPMALNIPPFPRGRLWAVASRQAVVLISDEGKALAVDPYWRRTLWPRLLELKIKPSGPPAAWEGQVFFGGREGDLWALDVQHQQVHRLASGLPRVVSAPAIGEDLLVTGGVGADHRLRAYDLHTGALRWESQPFAHSIATTPAIAEGLVVVFVNGGQIALLDAATGERFWALEMPSGGVPAQPLLHGGIIYAASGEGEAVALPWHLGQYERLAPFLEKRGRELEAGAFYAWAALAAAAEARAEMNQKAGMLWKSSAHPEWTAYLWANDLSRKEEEIARVYEEAALALAHRAPHEAVASFLAARKWYQRAGETARAAHCLNQVRRVARGPYLDIQGVVVPTRWQEEAAFTVVVELRNLGETPAEDIRVRFSGALRHRFRVALRGVLPPDGWVEVEAPLVAHEPGALVVEARYRDARGIDYVTTQTFAVREVVPFEGVLIEGSVGLAKGVAELLGLTEKVVVKGDVGFLDARLEQR